MSRLATLRAEYDKLRTGIETIDRAAEAESRDLTEQEQADSDALFQRMEAIRPDVEQQASRHQSIQAVGDVFARLGAQPAIDRGVPNVGPLDLSKITIGEYISRVASGDSEWIDRATQGTGDNPSIVPEEIIVGSLINLIDDSRPVFASMNSQPMPKAGKTFLRPRIVTHVQVGVQTAEFAALPSRKMALAEDTVTKVTDGGTLELSQQNIDWTDPSILNLVLQDFASMYAVFSEEQACTFMATIAGANTTTYTGTNIGSIVDSYVDAAIEVYGQAKAMPDTVWLSLDAWADLAKTTNATTDKSALAVLREAMGEFGASLKFVVGPGLAAATRIVGVRSMAESYEQRNGLLSVEKPSTLSREIAYYAYLAFYARPEGFTKLT